MSYRDEAKVHLPGGVSSSWQSWPPHPIYVDRGEGAYIWDIDQNRYVDYHNGYGVMVMGHAHPKIVEAVRRRVALGTHFAQPTEDALPVAEQLTERTGLPYWRFGNSGTEATLDAVRIDAGDHRPGPDPEDRGHVPRAPRRADGLGVPARGQGRAARPPELGPADRGHDPGTTDWTINVPFNDLEGAQRVFAERGDEIAGMIVEPVMTNCGVVLPDDGYLDGLKEVCHTHGAMFAFDEVKTGFTVGWGGAIEVFGVQPDLVAFAKALGAGLPCGAIGGTEEAMSRVIAGELDQVGTFNGNPLTMAAARVNLEEVLTKDAYVRLDEINDDPARVRRRDREVQAPRLDEDALGEGLDRLEHHADPRVPRPVGDRRPDPQLAWLWQLNRGVFKSPGSKWESWTTSIVMRDEDAQRYVDNFEEMAAAISR